MTIEATTTIKEIISENSKQPIQSSNLSDEVILEYDLCMDSMDKLHMVYELERQFNISISDREMASLVTVKDVLNCVNSMIGGK